MQFNFMYYGFFLFPIFDVIKNESGKADLNFHNFSPTMFVLMAMGQFQWNRQWFVMLPSFFNLFIRILRYNSLLYVYGLSLLISGRLCLLLLLREITKILTFLLKIRIQDRILKRPY